MSLASRFPFLRSSNDSFFVGIGESMAEARCKTLLCIIAEEKLKGGTKLALSKRMLGVE